MLLDREPISLDANTTRFTHRVVVPDQLATVDIRLERPWPTRSRVVWDSSSEVDISYELLVDGEKKGGVGGYNVFGGRQRKNRTGDDIDAILRTTPSWGFFGARSGFPKRLCETRITTCELLVRVVRISGTIDSFLTVSYTEAEAPRVRFQSSVAYDNAGSAISADDADAALTVTLTVGSGSDRAAFVGAGMLDQFNGPPTAVSATFAGNNMTEEWEAFDAIGVTSHAGYSIAGNSNVPTGSQDAVVSWTTGSADEMEVGVITMSGVDGTTPTGTAATATGTASPATVTVSGTVADGLVVDNLTHDFSSAPTVGANQTSRWTQMDSYAHAGAGSTQDGGDGGVMSWTMNGTSERDGWAIGAIEFKPVAAGGDARKRVLLIN